MKNYIPIVWDLIKAKKYDKAWKEIEKAEYEIMNMVSSGSWLNEKKYKDKAEFLNTDELKQDFRSELELCIYSMFYAKGEICWKEKKYNNAMTYLTVAYMIEKTGGVEKRLMQVKKKADKQEESEQEAKVMFDKWKELFKAI